MILLLCGCQSTEKPGTEENPPALEGTGVDGAAESFVVVQRGTEVVPGFDQRVTVHIGDVTAGQTLTSVQVEDRILVGQTPLREGDRISFSLVTGTYTLYLIKMVNFLIGDDYCVFVVAGEIPPEVRKVEILLHAVRHARVKFSRGEKGITPRQMEARFRMALAGRPQAGKTLEALLDLAEEIAKPSGDAGEILVKLPGNRIEGLVAWLQGRAALLCRESGKKSTLRSGE